MFTTQIKQFCKPHLYIHLNAAIKTKTITTANSEAPTLRLGSERDREALLMAHLAKQETGSSRSLRLDPYLSSHQLNVGDKLYKISRNGVVVKKTMSIGKELTMALPNKAFKGVAARAIEDEQGVVTVTLELLHHDPELCVPLLYANDMDDIAADWHSWSRLMKLPMLVVDLDNNPTAVTKQLGALMIEDPIARRKRITTVKHRPNFMRRRKMGVVGPVQKLTAAELIARR